MDKIKEIIKDTDFLGKISSASSDEEIQKILSEKNINISLKQLQEAKKIAKNMINKNGKMEDKELENIAGGKWYDGVYTLSKAAVAGALVYAVIRVTDSTTDFIDGTGQDRSRLTGGAVKLMGSTANAADSVAGIANSANGKLDSIIESIPFVGKKYAKNNKK